VKSKSTSIPEYLWKANGLPIPTPEFKFMQTRRFRIDYAFEYIKLAIEIEGGVWSGGRHTRGGGFIGDMEKYNLLTENGWRLLRYTPNNVDYDQIRRVIERIANEKEVCRSAG
jgi:very-short-patch-repair endonuclease